MTVSNEKNAVSSEILARAVEWHVLLHSETVGEEDWRAFQACLELDCSHRLAFDQVEDLYEGLDEIAPSELSAPALAVFPDRNEPRPDGIFSRRSTAVGAIALLAASILLTVWPWPNAERIYETKPGEILSVSLADGTKIDLNGGTRLSLSADKRQANLERGEAIFHVVHNQSQPFHLRAGDHEVWDIGTVFDVLCEGQNLTVGVAEGKVAVTSRTEQNAPVEITAGNRVQLGDGHSTGVVTHIDPDAVTAWNKGYLSYDNAPLSQVVSDLNRHFPRQIVLADAEHAPRFSGVLKLGKEEVVLKQLTELLPLTEDITGSNIVLHPQRHSE